MHSNKIRLTKTPIAAHDWLAGMLSLFLSSVSWRQYGLHGLEFTVFAVKLRVGASIIILSLPITVVIIRALAVRYIQRRRSRVTVVISSTAARYFRNTHRQFSKKERKKVIHFWDHGRWGPGKKVWARCRPWQLQNSWRRHCMTLGLTLTLTLNSFHPLH